VAFQLKLQLSLVSLSQRGIRGQLIDELVQLGDVQAAPTEQQYDTTLPLFVIPEENALPHLTSPDAGPNAEVPEFSGAVSTRLVQVLAVPPHGLRSTSALNPRAPAERL
jgi:hypothetical protein